MSYSLIAREIGVDDRLLRSWMNGRRNPGPLKLPAISRLEGLLGLTPGTLVSRHRATSRPQPKIGEPPPEQELTEDPDEDVEVAGEELEDDQEPLYALRPDWNPRRHSPAGGSAWPEQVREERDEFFRYVNDKHGLGKSLRSVLRWARFARAQLRWLAPRGRSFPARSLSACRTPTADC